MKHEKLLKSIMGEELYERLNKALTKLSTNSVVDIGEVYHSLKVAPKAVLSFLAGELRDMDDAKEIKLPWAEDAILLINKHSKDVYAGYIKEKGKITHEFQNTSLPALAAHMTSHFELYDENGKEQPEAPVKEEAPNVEDRIGRLEEKISEMQLKALESRINDLMALATKRKNIEKADHLEKAGLMPTMPHPPKPGTKVGGNQGLTTRGLKGPKTAATDRMSKPVSAITDKPQLNTTVKPKTLTFNKSDMLSKCMECGKSEFNKNGSYSGCDCWRGMSKPKVMKSEKDKITLQFGQDWDNDALVALIRSIKKYD